MNLLKVQARFLPKNNKASARMIKRVFGSAISSGVRSMRYCVSVIASSALPVPTAINPIDSAVIAFTYTYLKTYAL
jgi:hypothetical protein